MENVNMREVGKLFNQQYTKFCGDLEEFKIRMQELGVEKDVLAQLIGLMTSMVNSYGEEMIRDLSK